MTKVVRFNVYIILFIFTAISIHIPAFGALFERISRENGLSHTTVHDINQDSHGYIWIGTGDGLNRFDGYSFKVFRRLVGDDTSLSNNRVMKIFEDSQNRIWIGTRGGGLNLYDRQSDSFTQYRFSSDDGKSLSNDDVRAIYEDIQGNLWIGTRNGLNLFNPQTNNFTRFVHDKTDVNSLSHNRVSAIAHHPSGKLWVATMGGGLNLFDSQSGRFEHFRYDKNNPATLSSDRIYTLHNDQNDELWIGTLDDGLNRLDKGTQTIVRYPFADGGKNSVSYGRITSIDDDYLGRIWIGTYGGGINRLNPKTGIIHEYRSYGLDHNSISSDRIHKVYADVNGEIWIGTASGGLNKHNIRSERFGHVYRNAEIENSLSLNSVSAILKQSNGNLWVGTFGGGLNRFDVELDGFVYFRHDSEDPDSISHDNIREMVEDENGNLWINTFGGGLNFYDSSTGNFTAYKHQEDVANTISSNNLSALLIDKDGMLWIGTSNGGLNRFDRTTGQFEAYRHDAHNNQSISSDNIVSLYQDSVGIIWVGTSGGGLGRFDRKSGSFTHYRHNTANEQSLSHDVVLSIIEDSENRLWIGTRGGFDRLYRQSGKFERFGIREGLNNDVVHCILPDENNNLWFSTNDGLSQFNQVTKLFRHYRSKDGLQSNEFNRYAYFKSVNGELFFGGVNGFNRFFANTIVEDSKLPKVVLTDFRLFNQPVLVGPKQDDGVFTISRPIEQLQSLELDYGQNLMSFEFSALDFTDPMNTQYGYMLEGWDSDWILTDAKNRRAVYTNIPSGDYTLRIKARMRYGEWSERIGKLKIKVNPTKWLTWWAISLYLIVTLTILGTLMVSRSQRQKVLYQKQKIHDQQMLVTQLQKVDQLKDDFLANTSHELRTPLNGIIGLAESLIDGVAGAQNQQTKHNLALVVASGRRLSNLVNDILDFSKLKNQNLQIQASPVDIYVLVDVVLMMSKPLLGEKPLVLVNNVSQDTVLVMADENRVQQVLFNLVGNAVKFSDKGEVSVAASVQTINEQQWLNIAVIDSGIGIPNDKLESIFTSFEQVEDSETRSQSGTGLGLSVSRQLVELHGGQINAESTLGEGSCFSFTLPVCEQIERSDALNQTQVVSLYHLDFLDEQQKDEQQSCDQPSSVKPFSDQQEQGPKQDWHDEQSTTFRILLFDDEPINLQVLHNHLANQHYDLVRASDGEQALELIEQSDNKGECFDLILLDIMMPKLSGYQVCEALRKTHQINDLPVIFLTAKNQVSDLVKSYQVGANDYLAKPVAKHELLSRVETQLRLLDINRHLEQKVKDRTQELLQAEKMASLGTLTAGVAHEINNPNNFIHVSCQNMAVDVQTALDFFISLAGDDADDEMVASFTSKFEPMNTHLNTMMDGSQRIKTIVQDLRTFTQLDHAEQKSVVVTDLIQSTVNLIAAKYHKIIDFECRYIHKPQFECYPAQLNQVLMNIIVNACHAIESSMQNREVKGKVIVSCEQIDERIEIKISDNGCGMDETTQKQLFEPFYTTKDVGEGTGLGLSISYGIIERHGGEILVSSKLGQGSEFVIRLPLDKS